MNQKPSVGRIVHYHDHGEGVGPKAALITGVFENDERLCVDLIVWPCKSPHGLVGVMVPYSEEPKPGHWNWPLELATTRMNNKQIEALVSGLDEVINAIPDGMPEDMQKFMMSNLYAGATVRLLAEIVKRMPEVP